MIFNPVVQFSDNESGGIPNYTVATGTGGSGIGGISPQDGADIVGKNVLIVSTENNPFLINASMGIDPSTSSVPLFGLLKSDGTGTGLVGYLEDDPDMSGLAYLLKTSEVSIRLTKDQGGFPIIEFNGAYHAGTFTLYIWE